MIEVEKIDLGTKEISTVSDWLEVDDPICVDTVDRKYLWSENILGHKETVTEFLYRVSCYKKKYLDIIGNLFFIPGGRILANIDLNKLGIKCTYSNCYVIAGPEDNIESIYEVAKKMARTFSYGGGVGIDISRLAPRDARVRNTAEYSTGSVSFCETYSEVANTIGQNARRGALMICIRDDHPDLMQFITHKSDLNLTTGANMSVKMSDNFFETLKHGPIVSYKYSNTENSSYVSTTTDHDTWLLHFERPETGEKIEKHVNPNDVMDLIAKTVWDFGEPGVLFWDTINNYCLLGPDPDFKYEATNPCGELPLPNGGACLLGALNLSRFFNKNNVKINSNDKGKYGKTFKIDNQDFKGKVTIDEDVIDNFEYVVHTAIQYLDEVLSKNANLHPLKEQRESVKMYRPIGLGIMGLADSFVQCEIKYGSTESILLSDVIGYIMAFNAIEESCHLAKTKGKFQKCKSEYIVESEFYKYNVLNNPCIDKKRINALHNDILKYGLRNSQLLTIAPTGTTSTIINVSGGIEPIFSNHYTRMTKSISKDGDKTYEVYPNIVTDYALANPSLFKEDGTIDIDKLPEYFVTSKDIFYRDRINIQSVWQSHIDNSISSTVNLPEKTTVEEIRDLYIYAYEKKLKGITVFREGCKRMPILKNVSNDKENNNEETKNIPYKIYYAFCPKNVMLNALINVDWHESVPDVMDANDEIYVKLEYMLENGKVTTEPMTWDQFKSLCPSAKMNIETKDYLSNEDRKKPTTNSDDNLLTEKTTECEPVDSDVKSICTEGGIMINKSDVDIMKPKNNKLITRKELGKRLDASVHYINIACGHIYVVISRDENGRPVEVFMQSSKSGGCSANTECLGRFASACLRHGMDIDDVVDITKGVKCPACTNLKGKGIELDGLSCGDAMARVIKEEYENYKKISNNNTTKKNNTDIKDILTIDPIGPNEDYLITYTDGTQRHVHVKGDTSDKPDDNVWDYKEHSAQENIDHMICPECGEPLRFTEGCIKCLNCTFSKC